ncbi:MAG: hypothetical protein LBC72_01085, partial [Spirochaetaceae bacterium]|nr:hypothetical protein [Spirochaetaceae bacterium]
MLAFTSLFDFLELRFYDPSVTQVFRDELKESSRLTQRYFDELQIRFAGVVAEPAVRRSFSLNQSREDIFERARIIGSLQTAVPALQRVRFLDARGLRIHYSSDPGDVLWRRGDTISYRNYYEAAGFIPVSGRMTAGSAFEPEIHFENDGAQVVFYFPVFDSLEVYQGIALFSLAGGAIAENLAGAPGVTGGSVALISQPRGIVTGLPSAGADGLKEKIALLWNAGLLAATTLEDQQHTTYVLLTSKTSQNILVGRLCEERLFEFPRGMKILMLGCGALSCFIVCFLLFNLKHDPVVLVQNRLKSLQVRLVSDYYELKGELDWAKWRRELEQRRDDIREELRRGISVKKGSETDVYIDSFFEKSWDDLLAALGQRTDGMADEELKLETILKRILDATSALLPPHVTGAIPPELREEAARTKKARRKAPAPPPPPVTALPPAAAADVEALEELPEESAGYAEAALEELPQEAAGYAEADLEELPEEAAGYAEAALEELPEEAAGYAEAALE